MKIVSALLALLVSAAIAFAQSPVTVIGAVTPGNCVEFFSITQIKSVASGACVALTDFGTMAFENSNNVSITGGTLSGVTVSSSTIQGGNINNAAIDAGTITNVPTPMAAGDAVNKFYADTIASGLHVHPAVNLATAAALPSNTYSNGASGVGATLTATSNAALTVDGVAVSVSNRVLVKDESNEAHNGSYSVTATGDGSNPYVLTRSTDADTAAEMAGGDAFFVQAGTVNTSTTWINTTPVVTMGTTNIVFAQLSGPGNNPWQVSGSTIYYSAGNVGIGTNFPTQPLDVSGGVPRFRSLASCSNFVTDSTGLTSCNKGIITIGTGGTSNDTTTVQAGFTACNTGSGCQLICTQGQVYTIDKITISSGVDFNGAGCLFVQRTAAPTSDYALFDVNGATNVILRNMNLQGTVTGTNTPQGASGNSAVRIKNSDHVWVLNSQLNKSLYFGVEVNGSTYVWVDNNSLHLNVFGVFVSSADHVSITNNKIDLTALYSTTPTPDQFATAINLDSTEGGPSVSTNVIIANNHITRYPYAQGILAHAGQFVTITGNVINGSMAGISLNAHLSTDVLTDFTITGNVIIGNGGTTTLPPSSEDVGIFVGGILPATPASHITVSGNTVDAANRVTLDSSLGCYVFGYNIDITITGNEGRGCGGNGMVFITEEDGAAVSGNSMSNMVDTGGGHTYGYWWQGAPRATMMSNMAQNVNKGYVVDGADTNLKWKDSGGSILNGCYGVSTCNTP